MVNYETVTVETDLLILGGGMAACGAAVEASYWGKKHGIKITLVDKAAMDRSGAVAMGLSAINQYVGLKDGQNTVNDYVNYVRNDLMGIARDDLVANIARLVDKARAERVPVVWVQHSDEELTEGSEAWEFVPQLERHPHEPVVHKRYGDSFEATDLEDVLAERRVGRLVVTGAQSDMCIRCTLHGAFVRGYDVTLVEAPKNPRDSGLNVWHQALNQMVEPPAKGKRTRK